MDSNTPKTLDAYLADFRAAVSIWPEGLMVDGKRADLIQCQRMLDAIRNARDLDAAGEHAEFLQAMQVKVRIEIGQLRSDEGKCTF